MLTKLVSNYLSERTKRHRPVREAIDAITPPAIKRQRFFRRCLLLSLLFIGASSFVEVVVLPGKMIRDEVAPHSGLAGEVTDYPGEDLIRSFFQTDVSRRAHDDAVAKRLHDDVAMAYASYGDSVLALENAQAGLRAYARDRLGVDLRTVERAAVPASLADVVASEPTGASALSALLSLDQEVASKLKGCEQKLSLEGERFKSGSILQSDQQTLDSESAAVARLQISVTSAKKYVDHLFILKRERAALARFSRAETPSQE